MSSRLVITLDIITGVQLCSALIDNGLTGRLAYWARREAVSQPPLFRTAGRRRSRLIEEK
jgi:hypothetical protein